MKQKELRRKDLIIINCNPTFKEKLRLLFCKGFEVDVDLTIDSDSGVLDSEAILYTWR